MSALDIVAEITSGDRRRDYGRPLLNHARIALIWSTYLEKTIRPMDVAWMMNGLKLAREIETSKYDNLIDSMGYMVCIDDMIAQVIEHNPSFTKEDAIKYLKELTIEQMFYIIINW